MMWKKTKNSLNGKETQKNIKKTNRDIYIDNNPVLGLFTIVKRLVNFCVGNVGVGFYIRLFFVIK